MGRLHPDDTMSEKKSRERLEQERWTDEDNPELFRQEAEINTKEQTGSSSAGVEEG